MYQKDFKYAYTVLGSIKCQGEKRKQESECEMLGTGLKFWEG